MFGDEHVEISWPAYSKKKEIVSFRRIKLIGKAEDKKVFNPILVKIYRFCKRLRSWTKNW